jgi:DNA-directed RNA polymerase specialized sigma24 family protein
VPLEITFSMKSIDRSKRYIGRAAPCPSLSNNNELLWCEVADVSRALDKLPSDKRDILIMKYIREVGDYHIAQKLGVPSSAVPSIVSDSLDAIADILDGKG